MVHTLSNSEDCELRPGRRGQKLNSEYVDSMLL